ncbi:MAG: hypothetical protein AAGB51_04770 [Planctomycetota bacterium]
MPIATQATVGIYFEHPTWFRPLFDAFRRLGVAVEPIHVDELRDPERADRFSNRLGVVLNRMSVSAYDRGRPGAVTQARRFLPALESRGVRVINGSRAFTVETNKALQLDLIRAAGLNAPETIEARSPGLAFEAARAFGLDDGRPVIIKPNLGASGFGVRKLETTRDAVRELLDEPWDAGPDGVMLVQRYHRPRANQVIRIEALGGEFHYAVRITNHSDSFNLCPASVSLGADGQSLRGSSYGVSACRTDLAAEPFVPPGAIRSRAVALLTDAGIDVGGVEYLIDDETGEPVFYDINAMSNFVADGQRLLGFDPYLNLANYTLSQRATAAALVDEEAA